MAERNKKYYWLKLKEDFFEEKYIKALRKLPDGDALAIIYLKMQLKSLKTEGIIKYDKILPSAEEELALMLDEDVNKVKFTLSAIISMGLAEKWDGDIFYMTAMQNLIGSESAVAERVRKHRNKLKMLQCNTDETKCNEHIEKRENIKELEIEKEQELDKIKGNLFSYLENNFARTISPTEIDLLWSWLDTFTQDIIEYAIDISCFNNKKTIKYINGILNNWNSKGYKKLEECKEDSKGGSSSGSNSQNTKSNSGEEFAEFS